MKLIIDIDDEMVCNDIKNKALEPTSETDKVIINALYNGTPYEERPQGEWQPISGGNRYECNQCKEYAPSFKDGSEHLSNFCPNCGANMRKVGDT